MSPGLLCNLFILKNEYINIRERNIPIIEHIIIIQVIISSSNFIINLYDKK